MKRVISFLSAVFICLGVTAQTLNVVVGEVKYKIAASEAGDMVYSSGTTLSIFNKAFPMSDIDSMYVDNSSVTDNTVAVNYNGTTAQVVVAGNCMQYLAITASAADVSIVQDENVTDEITYTLSGKASDGSFYMDGELKATFILNGLNLTNTDGYAINIDDGKRIAVELADGTTNSLTDGSGSQNAAFMVNGHTEFTGAGNLTITGNSKHAFWGDEYVLFKKTMTGTITVAGAVKDGFNINQYMEQKGGNIVIESSGDDGIQVTATDNTDDENNGQVQIKGGTLDITVGTAAAKGITSDSTITIEGGTITVNCSGGGAWDSDDQETKACAGISSGDALVVSGGTLNLTSTGAGGKGMKCDGAMDITGGVINVITKGGQYTYSSSSTGNYPGHTSNTSSNLSSSAKGIKSKGDMSISGDANITVSTEGTGAEGIESKASMNISGGTVEVSAYDDAINSKTDMNITGGAIYVSATDNDGLDSNGDMWIKGGTIVAYGKTAPECGLDANEESGYSVHFTGGTFVAIGGGNSVPSESTSTQAYATYSGTVSNGTSYLLCSGSTNIVAFTSSRNYSSSGSGSGTGGKPNPGGGSSSLSMLISCPSLTSGSSYTLYSGSSVSGDSFHGLYTSPTVSSAGSTLSTLKAKTTK